MTHFNDQAATWDDPQKVKLITALAAKTIAALTTEQPLGDNLRIVDFGCGTGLFGLPFLPFAASLTGIDTSTGMLEVFQSKADGDPRVHSMCIDLEKEDLTLEADLILSAMAFHHLADPIPVLKKLKNMKAQNGRIAVVDLDEEDGSFHPDNKGMGVRHFGFSKQTVETWAKTCDLSLQHELIHHMEKNDRAYRIFLAVMR